MESKNSNNVNNLGEANVVARRGDERVCPRTLSVGRGDSRHRGKSNDCPHDEILKLLTLLYRGRLGTGSSLFFCSLFTAVMPLTVEYFYYTISIIAMRPFVFFQKVQGALGDFTAFHRFELRERKSYDFPSFRLCHTAF